MESKLHTNLRKYRYALATWFRRSSGKSDLKRWGNPSALFSEWDNRNQQIAELIESGSSVLEFGAGRMILKKHLKETCTYTPSDIVDRGEGTIICDLNAVKLPDFKPHDVVVCSGVIEYINDLPRFIAHLANIVKVMIVSYVLLENYNDKVERRANGWVNDYTAKELVALFASNGFHVEITQEWDLHRIFKFVRNN